MRLRFWRPGIRRWSAALKVLGIAWGTLFICTTARPFLIRAMLPGRLPAEICAQVAGCGALAVTAAWDAGAGDWRPLLDARTAAGQLPPDADALVHAARATAAQQHLPLAFLLGHGLAVRIDGRLAPQEAP